MPLKNLLGLLNFGERVKGSGRGVAEIPWFADKIACYCEHRGNLKENLSDTSVYVCHLRLIDLKLHIDFLAGRC